MRIGFMPFKNALLSHPFALFGKLALCIGLFLFVLGVVLAVITHTVGADESTPFTMLMAISSQGVVWLILGIVFGGIAHAAARKLNDLQQRGQRFEAEIMQLTHVMGVNASLHTPTVRAECIYINEQQQRCKVRSAMFLWENFNHEKLQAVVYVDWNDPRRYAVAVTRQEDLQQAFDVDYT